MVNVVEKIQDNVSEEMEVFLDSLMKRNKPLIFFGAGFIGKMAYDLFNHIGIKPDFFCDNNEEREGTLFLGVPVISFRTLSNQYLDSNILITTKGHFNEIRRQLYDNGLKDIKELSWLIDYQKGYSYGIKGAYYPILLKRKLDVEEVYNHLSDELSKEIFYKVISYREGNSNEFSDVKSSSPPYFEQGLIKLTEHEVFIDGGAFDGDTVKAFLKELNGKFQKIISFEPDKDSYNKLSQSVANISGVIAMPYGLWNKKENLKFKKGINPEGNRILDEDYGETVIETVSIDEIIKEEIPTFIKMDIEGAEIKALEGAKETIVKYKPKLAICVYHKPFDIIDIPLFIKNMVPGYKLYIRHYSNSFLDTILYAIPGE